MLLLQPLGSLVLVATAFAGATKPSVEEGEKNPQTGGEDDFLHDAEIVSSQYLTFGDYGCYLGNYATPDTVSGDFAHYDQRWFEALTGGVKEERLVQGLEREADRDRFFFLASQSMANYMRAVSTLLSVSPGKTVHVDGLFSDLLLHRTDHMHKALNDSFLEDTCRGLARNLTSAGPRAINRVLPTMPILNMYERALLERIWLYNGMSTAQVSDHLVLTMRLLEQTGGDRDGTLHVTPDFAKLLASSIVRNWPEQRRAISFFMHNIQGSHKDLFVSIVYFLNMHPDGWDCVVNSVDAAQLDQLQYIPADSFFPRVNYPLHPTLYLVHAPSYHRQRASNVGLFHFASTGEQDSLPGSAHRIVVHGEDDLQGGPGDKIKLTLSKTERLMTIKSGFHFNLFRIRESANGRLTLTVVDSHSSVESTSSAKGRAKDAYVVQYKDFRRGDIIGLFDGSEQIPDNIVSLIDLAWSGTRREILLQVAASLPFVGFQHVMLVEAQPKPPSHK